MTDSACARRFYVTVTLVVALVPLLMWGTWHSARSMFNDPTEWVPRTFHQRQNYQWFVESFERGDAVILSWPGCTVDDDRLPSLQHELTASPVPHLRTKYEALIDRVITGHSAVRELTQEPSSLSRRSAIQRLEGTLVGPDGSTSCAMIVLTPTGARQRARSIQTILDAAEEVVGLQSDRFFLIGLPVDGHTIDLESIRSLGYYAIPSALVAWMICCICLRCWRFTLLIVLVAVVGECLTMTLVSLGSQPMNAVLIVMPPLMFVLTVSAGVHLVNYYYDEVRLRGTAGSVRRAMANGWLPCVLAATTTALGLASLAVSDVGPVRVFGVISAVGILATVALLLLLLPGAMGLWPVEARGSYKTAETDPANSRSKRPRGWLASLPEVVCRYHLAIVAVFLGLMLLSAWGLRQLHTSVSIRSLLSQRSRVMRDYRWIETNIGPMVPVEVVIHFANDCDLDIVRRLEIVRGIQQDIAAIDTVQGVTSAATFLPSVPKRTWQKAVLGRKLRNCCETLSDRKYLAQEPDRQSWRISGRVGALADIDYGRFLGRLENRVDLLLAESRGKGVEGISATCTGMMPLIDEAQRALLRDLFASFMLAFAAVSLVMILSLRSIWAGLVAMLPNAFPTVILFGIMGWLGRPVDVGCMMTASVAMGVAVDGTLHFLTWYRREMERQATPREAVCRCFGHCGRAMAQTTVICGLGMLVFAFSGFMPTRSFAWMMFTLLGAALVGDFVLLPALLVGPLGRAFARRQVSPADKTTQRERTQPARLVET